jgi:predicted MFS family arabinose efflux permease
VLIGARALQGAFGALLVPSSLAIITTIYPPGERAAAIGSWTAGTSAAIAVGPPLGGLLVDAISWRVIFAMNLPLVLVCLWLIARAVPECPGDREHRIDIPGAVLCVLGLAGPTYALIQQPLLGFSDARVWLPLIGGIGALGAFVAYEQRAPDPMLPPSIFRSRNFAVGNVVTLTAYAGLGAASFFIAIFLQQIAGYSALQAGLALLPITLLLIGLSRRFGALAARVGPRLLMSAGPFVGGLGLLAFTRVDARGSYVADVLPATLLFGLGLAMTVAPLTATVLQAAERRHAGIASGVNNAIARVAALVTIAAVGAVVTAHFGSKLDERLGPLARQGPVAEAVEEAKKQPLAGVSVRRVAPDVRREVARAGRDASVSAFRLGAGIAAALVGLGGVLGLIGIENPRRRVEARECPGGQLVGVAREGASQSPCDWQGAPA